MKTILAMILFFPMSAFAEDAPKANLPKGGPFVNESGFPDCMRSWTAAS